MLLTPFTKLFSSFTSTFLPFLLIYICHLNVRSWKGKGAKKARSSISNFFWGEIGGCCCDSKHERPIRVASSPAAIESKRFPRNHFLIPHRANFCFSSSAPNFTHTVRVCLGKKSVYFSMAFSPRSKSLSRGEVKKGRVESFKQLPVPL